MFKGPRSDVETSEVGRSIAALLYSRSERKAAWAALDRLQGVDVAGEAVDAVVTGLMGGFLSVWALTGSRILILPPSDVESQAIDLSEIRGVRITSSTGLLVRTSSGHHSLGNAQGRSSTDAPPTSEGVSEFSRLLCERTGQTISPTQLVFTPTGTIAASDGKITVGGDYLGGYPTVPKAEPVTLAFDDDGVQILTSAWFCTLALPWSDVTELVVEGTEETRRRITATRMLAVGLFAFAFPKEEKRNHAYIIATTSEGEFIVRTTMTPHEARAKLGPYLRRPVETRAVESVASGSAEPDQVATALRHVAELHAQGALTDEEFTVSKRRILGIDG